MWPYMCLCCGLFVPTQFHFECCGVRDDMYISIYTYFWIYRYVNVYEYVFVNVYAYIFLNVQENVKIRDLESGLSKTKSVWS